MFKTSERLSLLPKADIREMTRQCIKVGGYNLSQGVCDLPTPNEILSAAMSAIESDKSVYAPANGIESLRELIAEKVKRDNQISCGADDIIVSAGVTGAFASILTALFEPGDGVMLIEPYYGYHYNECIVTNVVPQVAQLKDDFTVDVELLQEALRPNTRAIVICSPSNPSGRMYSEAELKSVLQFAEKNDLLVICDEIYEYFRYDGREHISMASLDGADQRVITMMGLSKTFSITGWRLGYVVSPKWANQAISKTNDLLYVCAPTPLQYGAVAGFKLPESYYAELIEVFSAKRNKFCSALEKAGLNPLVPQGSYYVLANVESLSCANSIEASKVLLNEAKVASVPGQAFFQSSRKDQYVRFCFGVNEEVLDGAIDSILKFSK